MAILFISRVTIWSVFQNPVTYVVSLIVLTIDTIRALRALYVLTKFIKTFYSFTQLKQYVQIFVVCTFLLYLCTLILHTLVIRSYSNQPTNPFPS